jgi:hypothetical protein
MPDAIAENRMMGMRRLALRMTLLCLPLAGCSSGGESMTLLVSPGKYEYYNCEQLSGARKAMVARQQELKGLIEQAERGTGGAFVSAIAYRSDYEQQNQEVRVIDATAREKDCLTTATWRSNAVIQ